MRKNIYFADISGKGIKKRCRKEDFIYIQSWGETEELAIKNLKEFIPRELFFYKTYKLNTYIGVYEGEEDNGSLIHKLTHMSDNYHKIDFTTLLIETWEKE